MLTETTDPAAELTCRVLESLSGDDLTALMAASRAGYVNPGSPAFERLRFIGLLEGCPAGWRVRADVAAAARTVGNQRTWGLLRGGAEAGSG